MTIEGRATFPATPNGYDVAMKMSAKLTYADGVELEILDEGRNGILFEGEAGHLFVNRGTIAGPSVDRLDEQPLAREQFKLYGHDNPRQGDPAARASLDSIIKSHEQLPSIAFAIARSPSRM